MDDHGSDSPLRRVADHLPPEWGVALASIDGELKLIRQIIESQGERLASAMQFGDRQNAQAIVGLQTQVDTLRREADLDRGRVAATRKLVWSTVAAPIIVGLVLALLLVAVKAQ